MGCIIGDFKYIIKVVDKTAKAELQKRNVPVLAQHIPLFHLVGAEHVQFNQLQKQLQTSKSTLSDTINKYSDLGLMNKGECPHDKRNLYVSLTADGIKAWEHLIEIDQMIKDRMFIDFDQAESIQIEESVHKMMENIK